jgi:exocyst complex component 7
MVLFSANLTSFLSLVKRSLQSYTFLALSAYEYLISLSSRFEAVLAYRDSSSNKNEFREGLTQLRSVVLRSFPTVLAEIKYAAMGGPGKGMETQSTGLSDFVVSVGSLNGTHVRVV